MLWCNLLILWTNDLRRAEVELGTSLALATLGWKDFSRRITVCIEIYLFLCIFYIWVSHFTFFFLFKKQSTNICNFSIIGSFYRILNLITDLTKCLRCCLFFIWNLNFTYSQTFITFNLFVFLSLISDYKMFRSEWKKKLDILTFILMAKTSKWNFNIIAH